ncbi:MAG: hypothetical protein H0U92_11080, partial [Actinobacteria bacterium]|nr:hypothetical protein [Actinomycetota bacterium]
MLGKLLTAKALAVVGAVALTGGAAAAATGILPDPVQDAAAHTVERVGIHIPADDDAADAADAAD